MLCPGPARRGVSGPWRAWEDSCPVPQDCWHSTEQSQLSMAEPSFSAASLLVLLGWHRPGDLRAARDRSLPRRIAHSVSQPSAVSRPVLQTRSVSLFSAPCLG